MNMVGCIQSTEKFVKKFRTMSLFRLARKLSLLRSLLDANLYHDLIMGRAVTGVLHLINGTPIDWYSKRQGTIETATYGAEFVAAHIATEQIMD